MNEVYISLVGGAATFLAGFTGWFWGRRKSDAEALTIEVDAKGKEIDNEIKLSSTYKDMLDDLGTRYEKKYSDIVALYEQKASIMQDEINLLKSKNKMLTQENTALRKKIKELEG